MNDWVFLREIYILKFLLHVKEIDVDTYCSLSSEYWTKLVLILQRPKQSVLSPAFPIQELLLDSAPFKDEYKLLKYFPFALLSVSCKTAATW